MRHYLDAMDAAAHAYRAAKPAAPPPRVLAALGPRMLALAAERAQGAHPYLVTPDHTAKARSALGPRVCFKSGRGLVRCSRHGTRRPDQRAVGQAGAASAHRLEARPATHLEQAATHQRNPLADPDRGAVAGPARPLRALADRGRAVSALAARRHLATDPHRPAGPGRRQGPDHRAGQRRLHGRQGAPARRRRPQRGTANAKHRAESTSSRTTMGSAAPGVG
jgi:hypothetical protein